MIAGAGDLDQEEGITLDNIAEVANTSDLQVNSGLGQKENIYLTTRSESIVQNGIHFGLLHTHL